MPVTRPAYGRKPGPFVTAPDTNSKKAKAKAAAAVAEKAALDGAVTAVILASTITS
jgi:hypothetical protein